MMYAILVLSIFNVNLFAIDYFLSLNILIHYLGFDVSTFWQSLTKSGNFKVNFEVDKKEANGTMNAFSVFLIVLSVQIWLSDFNWATFL